MRRDADCVRIWDEVRLRWLMLTPEEWVRQHMIRYLSEACSVPRGLIVQEDRVELNGQRQRADIVVYGRNGKPCLIVECKEPDIEIDVTVLAQAMRYNSVLGAPLVLLTNGRCMVCFTRNAEGRWCRTERIPDLLPLLGIE